jgi:predicted nucleic acid-binding protein
MSVPLIDFTGPAIYIDTMVPYALLRSVNPTAEAFFERLEKGAFLAYTSLLTLDELAYRLLLALTKDRYGGSPLDRLRDEEEKMRRWSSFRPMTSIRVRNQVHSSPGLRAFLSRTTRQVYLFKYPFK